MAYLTNDSKPQSLFIQRIRNRLRGWIKLKLNYKFFNIIMHMNTTSSPQNFCPIIQAINFVITST